MNDWVQEQIAALKSMYGKTVRRWIGLEMALRDNDGGLPEWENASIPFLQLERIDAVLEDGETARIVTYQNDDQWGIWRHDQLVALLPHSSEFAIYRTRELDELPLGEITNVEVEADDRGDIAAVRFLVAGHCLTLRAGEVYEESDGSLKIVWMDESILLDVDGRKPNRP
ncbi:MAG: hypothetical protein ABFD16_30595 [Thermoguttaceae bacterium]|jgi:hypothetical protein